ncbi:MULTISPECIES: cardiolipin synthase ClsB [Pseudomonas]|jgi:cardiolipin synthase|uniref:Cardiolipin synthase B n=2 Tax=Pseudomonas fluorescens group TaxID=136843 RepID=A0AB36D6M0_9PSED|nr:MULTISPECIES: cardiolipin synthase ClsB [Pseudomonas]MBU0521854.1 cardiolipin synthase ClsB [Gammaproteobacteria bacterium]MDF9884634.1 cardiolipin synthase [Pseudomonas silensiensis]MBU0817739.1 cardiolipin synthase ClsB [Gammaproteobacteria bacterium]MBU0840951.1 cardiolipin synthase ClsB [Gammaproteobacteria bacterium]MBU1838886.1 cardiolipin synthase ClsB [Gammaproteobacteria bacterium]
MSSAPMEKATVEHVPTTPPVREPGVVDVEYGWQGNNLVEMLENGEAYFPRVFEAMRQAKTEILLETFIVFEDKVGNELQQVLVEAAQRGVRVTVSLDGFGCGELSNGYLATLSEAGVRLQIFDPAPKLLGIRTNWFRRLHRKIVVVDGTIAFIGGINFSADHLADFGPEAKQDYSVEVQGPAVADIHHFALLQCGRPARAKYWWQRRRQRRSELAFSDHDGQVRLVYRDNGDHRTDIEEVYLQVLRSAQRRVVIANAYFFPGYRLLREIRNAARRGVDVRLILQGQPDMMVAKLAARMTYDYLLKSGVQIFEYCERPLHGKVALVDEDWSTVGSSNLDPLSLSMNLEANVLIRDRAFNQDLFERLEVLSNNHCKAMSADTSPRGRIWHMTVGFLVFHFLRHFPAWAGWLPAHKPRLKPFTHPAGSDHHEPR